jgi:hypothetical protein
MGNNNSNYGNDEKIKINNTQNTAIDNSDHISLFYQVITNDLIFQQLQEFLNDTNIGTNNLLNVSKRCFHHLKKENYYWKLNRQYSLIYYLSLKYRESILTLMNTRRQLSLDLSNRSIIVDVSVLSEEYDLNLSKCLNLIDVRPLSKVHILNLSRCQSLIDVRALSDVPRLGDIIFSPNYFTTNDYDYFTI